MNVATGQWICFHADCHDEEGAERAGNLRTLERKLTGTVTLPGPWRSRARVRARESSGAKVAIAEQLARTKFLLRKGLRHNDVVRALVEEFGISKRTAEYRVQDVQDGAGGPRRQEALVLSERFREGEGRRSGRGPLTPFLKRSESVLPPQTSPSQAVEVESEGGRPREAGAPSSSGEVKAAPHESAFSQSPRPRDDNFAVDTSFLKRLGTEDLLQTMEPLLNRGGTKRENARDAALRILGELADTGILMLLDATGYVLSPAWDERTQGLAVFPADFAA